MNTNNKLQYSHMNVKRQGSAIIPTEWGDFEMIAYSDSSDDRMPHLALVNIDPNIEEPINIRIHSECITGDLFGSYRCECGEQLSKAMEYIATNGGVLVYLRQEGRDIGIIKKLHAYVKQDEGLNTAEANKALGLEYDSRVYSAAIAILHELNITEINLLTNNPDKIKALQESTIKLIKRIPLQIPSRPDNEKYIETKIDFFGHLFT